MLSKITSSFGFDSLFRLVQHRSFLPVLFIIAFTPLLLFLAVEIPPGESPDEPTQVARASSLLHGQIVGMQWAETDATGHPMTMSGVIANLAPILVTTQFFQIAPDLRMTSEIWAKLDAIPWAERAGRIGAPNTAPYFPVFYGPMALGLGAGHVLGYTPLQTVLLGRCANALGYVLVGALALLVARRGRTLLFLTLTLPMSLWLAATCNQDSLMLAATCLAAGLLTASGPLHRGRYWWAGLLLACVIAVKPPYAVLAAVMLLPVDLSTRAGRRQGAAGLALAVVPMLVWTPLAQSLASGVFIQGPPYTPGPLWPGAPDRVFIAPNAGAQLRVFLHRPTLLLTLPLAALWADGAWKLHEMVGVLAALRIVLSSLYYQVLFAGLLLGVVLALRRPEMPQFGARPWKAAMMLVAVCACIILIYDAQYLSWTLVGRTTIDGVQGRYFLPFIPLIGVGLSQVQVWLPRPVAVVLQAPVLLIALFGTVFLPALVVTAYFQP